MFLSLLFAKTDDKTQDILHVNTHIYPTLQSLITTDYFRFVSINLFKDCPFWTDNGICMRRDCSVNQKKIDLDTVKLENTKINNPFCNIEEDPEYIIDLIENPERYTGYAGESANQVWSAIYQENCFDIPSKFQQSPYFCKETMLFYELVSGLHTSISMHICGEYFDDISMTFKENSTCYEQRIGRFPDRIQNMLTLFAMMTKSLFKIQEDMINIITGNDWEDFHIKSLMDQLLLSIKECPTMTDKIFHEKSLKGDFLTNIQQKFNNISTIMDCVGCEKCRLWGKVQIGGIGTAFKVLTSNQPLQRQELVFFVNALNRLSESIKMLDFFERKTKKEDSKFTYVGGNFHKVPLLNEPTVDTNKKKNKPKFNKKDEL